VRVTLWQGCSSTLPNCSPNCSTSVQLMASTVGTAGGQIIARALTSRQGTFALLRQVQAHVPEQTTNGASSSQNSAASRLFYSGAVLMSLLGFSVSLFSLTKLQSTSPPKTLISLTRSKHD